MQPSAFAAIALPTVGKATDGSPPNSTRYARDGYRCSSVQTLPGSKRAEQLRYLKEKGSGKRVTIDGLGTLQKIVVQ